MISCGKIALTMNILIHFRSSVQGCPLRIFFEKSHGLDILQDVKSSISTGKGAVTNVFRISSETMIYSCREKNQIVFLQPDAYPVVLLAAHIEESLSVKDVPDLLVLVKVLIEENLHLVFVAAPHLFRRDRDLISILVAAIHCDGIDLVDRRTPVINHTELTQIFSIDRSS